MREPVSRNDFMNRVRDYALTLPGAGTVPYGIGSAWLGRKGLDRDTLNREAGLLEFAYRQGFKYYDTSAAYGDSELVVGQFVSRIPRPNVFLATKSRIPEHLSPRLAAEHVRRGLEASLERMNTDHLDLFQVHDVSRLHQVLPDDGVLGMLTEAKKQGRIRNIGLATRDLDLLRQAVTHGGFDTVLTYSDYTPIDVSAADLIRFAGSRGVGVINGSPLSAGLLTGADSGSWNDKGIPELVSRKQRAVRLIELFGSLDPAESVLAFALQFPIRNSGIHMTLTGPSSIDDIRSTLTALQRRVPERIWTTYAAWAETNLGS